LPTLADEREVFLRELAVELVAQLGTVTARCLASHLDEWCDELSFGDGTVHAGPLQEEAAP
jgi:hypothetical protein